METLFDIEEIEKTPTSKCKQCEHIERSYFGKSTIIFYCSVRKSNMTANGKLKIKANKTSCLLFKQYERKADEKVF
jgi:hypothetical protein